jgi:hypothetical protein
MSLSLSSIPASQTAPKLPFVSDMKNKTNPFLENAYRRMYAKEGLPYPPDDEKNPDNNQENLVAKHNKWNIAGKLSQRPGASIFDGLEMVGLSKIGDVTTKEAAGVGDLFKVIPKLFQGGKIVAKNYVTTGSKGKPLNEHWAKLIKETNPNNKSSWSDFFLGSKSSKGKFNSNAGAITAPLFRAGGGGILGNQFDTDESKEKGYFGIGPNAILGAGLGVLSPYSLKMLANKSAPKDTITRLLSNNALQSRVFTEPLTRTVGGYGVGSIFDSGMDALGYDTNDAGKRFGIGMGLAGGMRPTAQLLGGRYKNLGKNLTYLGNTAPGRAFTNAQKGGFGNALGWTMGSHYAAGLPFIPLAAQQVGDRFIGDRLRTLGEKSKLVREAIESKETQPAMLAFQDWFKKSFPNTPLFDADGLPSVQALRLMKQYGITGLGNLNRISDKIFADPKYLYNIDNWSRLGQTDKMIYDIVNGRYQQAENYLRNLGAPVQ